MALRISGVTVIDDDRKLTQTRLTTSVINVNTTAVYGTHYVATASVDLTLPTPAVGDMFGFTNLSGTLTCRLVTGDKVMNETLPSSVFTIDILNTSFRMTYTGATQGWVLC